MDLAAINAAFVAIKSAKDLASAAIEIRDFNASATAIARVNEQLLKAQEALFTHNTSLMQLQSEHFEATKKLRELEEALADRKRYKLFALAEGVFVMKSDPAEFPSEPDHFLCQPCFDRGIKAVLQRRLDYGGFSHDCPVCKNHYFVRSDAAPVIGMRPYGG